MFPADFRVSRIPVRFIYSSYIDFTDFPTLLPPPIRGMDKIDQKSCRRNTQRGAQVRCGKHQENKDGAEEEGMQEPQGKTHISLGEQAGNSGNVGNLVLSNHFLAKKRQIFRSFHTDFPIISILCFLFFVQKSYLF